MHIGGVLLYDHVRFLNDHYGKWECVLCNALFGQPGYKNVMNMM